LVYDFGEQPLAGVFPEFPESVEKVSRYPLDLTRCDACSLLQVTNLPPIQEVFHADYRYSSSTVPGLVRHFEGFADWLFRILGTGALVFEFGCNDGVLLERLRARGIECSGIDASDNVASLAREKRLNVSTGFLTPQFVHGAGLSGSFDLVTCSNVFAHIHDLGSVLESVRLLLRPSGLFAVEVHDGDLLIKECQFDTIYHEHLTYFTESTLREVLAREGFEFVRCEKTPMHGGSLRFLARSAGKRTDAGGNSPTSHVEVVSSMKGAVERCRRELQELYARNGKLVGYGAAGRSQMFLNVTGTGKLFDQVFDDSPLRQGRFVAGTDIPISAYSGQLGRCVVLLAWNYAPEISARVGRSYEQVVTLLPSMRLW
jgi:SAM-dependent methyltransferase